MSLWVRCAVLASICTSGVSAAQSQNPFLDQARENFKRLDYESCIVRARQASKVENTPRDSVEIELYAGLCHYYLARETEAREHFEMALRLDPEVQLPEGTSPKARAFFEVLAPPIRKAASDTGTGDSSTASLPPVEPPRDGAQGDVPSTPTDATSRTDAPIANDLKPPSIAPERVPAGTPASNAVVAARRPLPIAPIVLGGVGLTAAGVATGFGLNALSLSRAADGANFQSEAAHLHRQAGRSATTANIAWAAAGAAATGAVVTWLFSPNEAPPQSSSTTSNP